MENGTRERVRNVGTVSSFFIQGRVNVVTLPSLKKEKSKNNPGTVSRRARMYDPHHKNTAKQTAEWLKHLRLTSAAGRFDTREPRQIFANQPSCWTGTRQQWGGEGNVVREKRWWLPFKKWSGLYTDCDLHITEDIHCVLQGYSRSRDEQPVSYRVEVDSSLWHIARQIVQQVFLPREWPEGWNCAEGHSQNIMADRSQVGTSG